MRWVAPVLMFGLPLVALVAALSFIATPWAKMKSAEFVERFEKREDLKRVSPGQFRESTACLSRGAPLAPVSRPRTRTSGTTATPVFR